MAFAEQLRAGSTSWAGDHGAFVDQLARRGIALLHGCGVEPGTVLEVGNTIGFAGTCRAATSTSTPSVRQHG